MWAQVWLGRWLPGICLGLLCSSAFAGQSFRVATYNVEGYLLKATQHRKAKPAIARAKVRESIRAAQADVVALQEIGGVEALDELRGSLKAEGCDYPYWEHVPGADTNIQVSVLSKFPFCARRSHTNEDFLLTGRRFRTSRGVGEVEVQVNSNYGFTLITCHLKSRLPVPAGDESELRLEEAKIVREKVDDCLGRDPNVNLVVLGDFNDTPDSASTRTIIGRGRGKLVDTRPAEADEPVVERKPGSRAVTWTHFYGQSDTYSRIDFILLSRGMAREWVTNEAFVLKQPGWGLASDHRPVVATFQATEQ
jgi:endonuclease/exonuclease/phosphatase family metal-dependent hydrolase